MLEFAILLVVLSVSVYIKWDTISPKLIVREGASWAGAVVGATPEVIHTTKKVIRAANAKSELELKEAGEEGPLGFKEGRIVTKKAVRDAFSSINSEADKLYKESNKKLEAMADALA